MSLIIHPQQHYNTSYIFRMAVPLMLSFLLEQLIGMTDVAFLGRVGEVELGAAALAGVYFLTLLMLGLGYSFGVQAYMSRRNGEKAHEDIGRAFRSGLIFLLMLSLGLILASNLLSKLFFDATCESPAVANASDTYLFWRVWGLPFAFASAIFRAFFIATLKPTILTASSLVMVGTNVVLNYMLIFGFGPIPAQGIAGAAIASTVSEIVCLLFFVLYTFRKVDHRRYALLGPVHWESGLQRTLFHLGRWLMIQEAFAFFAWLLFFLAVEHLGELPLAISNIVRQLCSTFFLFIHAFGSTCGAIAANLIGEGRPKDVPALCRRGLVTCTLCMLPFMLLVCAFPETTLSVFTNLNDVVDASLPTFFVMMGSFFIAIPSMYMLFVMGGMGLTKESSVATMFAAVAYLVFIFTITRLTGEVHIVWFADYVYYLVASIVLGYYWKRGAWRRQL